MFGGEKKEKKKKKYLPTTTKLKLHEISDLEFGLQGSQTNLN